MNDALLKLYRNGKLWQVREGDKFVYGTKTFCKQIQKKSKGTLSHIIWDEDLDAGSNIPSWEKVI